MSTEEYMLSARELDEKGEILVKAEDIKADDKIYRAVTKHMKEKAGKINRIADLRAKLAGDMGSMPNQKEMVEL